MRVTGTAGAIRAKKILHAAIEPMIDAKSIEVCRMKLLMLQEPICSDISICRIVVSNNLTKPNDSHL